jgi:hypothetical protein
MQPVTIFTTRHFVDHELRGNQADFWSLEFEPLLCLNLQGRDCGIFARPSSRVTDNLSFYVYGIHASILPQRSTRITGRRKLSLLSRSPGHRRSRACDGSSRFSDFPQNYFDSC